MFMVSKKDILDVVELASISIVMGISISEAMPLFEENVYT